MPFLPVILWTDLLLFALIPAAIGAGLYVRRQPHLLAGWRQVMGNGAAMASATVLAVFIVIGVLDSLHFRAPLEGGKGKAPRSVLEQIYAPGVHAHVAEQLIRESFFTANREQLPSSVVQSDRLEQIS